MKRYFMIFLASMAVLSGCSRSEMPGENASQKVPDGLRARATLGDGVKSHFDIDGLSLVWDSTDKLFAYSAYIGKMADYEAAAMAFLSEIAADPANPTSKEMKDAGILTIFRLIRSCKEADQLKKGVFNISPTGSGRKSATFVSPNSAEEWFGKENPAEDDFFIFPAFYPAQATVPDLEFYCFPEFQGNYAGVDYTELPFPYINVTVPQEQDGVSYNKYQLLMAKDSPFTPKNVLLRTDEELDFGTFSPLTSILEFTLGTTDDIHAEIARMEITLSTQEVEGEAYVSNKYRIAGTVPMFFTWNGVDELRLWNRAHTPLLSSIGDENHAVPDPDDWSGIDDATPTITIKFDSPVAVSQQQTAKKYYAVMIPSRCASVMNCGHPKLTFDAYNAAGDKILTKTITTSRSSGIDEGRKYSFDLTLDTYYAPDVLSGLFSVAEGKQIYIANGNLQAYLTPGGTVTKWRFAPHQYDFVGATSYDLSSYAGWFDLFSFSAENNNFGISTSIDDDDHLGEARGWTDAYPVAQGRGWRTITDEEGLYLFGVRENAGILFSFATVVVGSENREVKGLIFLPDNWELPENCTFNGMFVAPQYDYSKNIYYAENAPAGDGVHNKWEDMQAAGAVFWPAAGMRQGTDVDLTIGAYWSGTPNDEYPTCGNMLFFCDDVEGVREGSFIPSHYPRSNGACVRLIKEFN